MIYLYLFGTCFHFIYVFMIIGNYHILYLYFYFMPIGLALAGKMPVLSPAGFHSGVDRIFNTGNAPLSFLSGLHSDL